MKKSPKQFYRVVLNSINKKMGDNTNAYFNVPCHSLLPADNTKKFNFAVESFMCDGGLQNILCYIPSLTQIDSYNTLSTCENQLVFMTALDNYTRYIHHDSVGHLLSNVDALRNGFINVLFKDLQGNKLTNMGDWVMSIVLWEVEQDDD
jgi:hypothetical protein